MPPSSSEASVVRSYVETLLELPWKKKSRVNRDIERARRVLDEDHWGLEKVKERILEYLAVQKRVGKVKSPILCLVGVRRRQNFAWPLDCPGDEPRIRTHGLGRRFR